MAYRVWSKVCVCVCVRVRACRKRVSPVHGGRQLVDEPGEQDVVQLYTVHQH